MFRQQEKIREGMTVLDVEGNRIGTVEFVKFGDEDVQRPGTEANQVSPTPRTEVYPNFLEDIAAAISGENSVPEEVRANLLRLGYMKIGNTGLFKGSRYTTLDNVDHVHDDHVHLTIDNDALISV